MVGVERSLGMRDRYNLFQISFKIASHHGERDGVPCFTPNGQLQNRCRGEGLALRRYRELVDGVGQEIANVVQG
jgi:hypothetical protein